MSTVTIDLIHTCHRGSRTYLNELTQYTCDLPSPKTNDKKTQRTNMIFLNHLSVNIDFNVNFRIDISTKNIRLTIILISFEINIIKKKRKYD